MLARASAVYAVAQQPPRREYRSRHARQQPAPPQHEPPQPPPQRVARPRSGMRPEVPSLSALMAAGVQWGKLYGRHTRAMRPYLLPDAGHRWRYNVFDTPCATMPMLEEALAFLEKVAASSRDVLFVGVTPAARQAVSTAAQRCGSPFVVTRWVGGTLSNNKAIQRAIDLLVEESPNADASKLLTGAAAKKAAMVAAKRRERAERKVGGLRGMTRLPGALFVVDAAKHAAVLAEAKTVRIPVVAVCDSDTQHPLELAYPIPANASGPGSVRLLAELAATRSSRAAVENAARAAHASVAAARESLVQAEAAAATTDRRIAELDAELEVAQRGIAEANAARDTAVKQRAEAEADRQRAGAAATVAAAAAAEQAAAARRAQATAVEQAAAAEAAAAALMRAQEEQALQAAAEERRRAEAAAAEARVREATQLAAVEAVDKRRRAEYERGVEEARAKAAAAAAASAPPQAASQRVVAAPEGSLEIHTNAPRRHAAQPRACERVRCGGIGGSSSGCGMPRIAPGGHGDGCCGGRRRRGQRHRRGLVSSSAAPQLPLVACAPDKGAAVGGNGGGVRGAGCHGNAAGAEECSQAPRPRRTRAQRARPSAQLPSRVGAPGIDITR